MLIRKENKICVYIKVLLQVRHIYIRVIREQVKRSWKTVDLVGILRAHILNKPLWANILPIQLAPKCKCAMRNGDNVAVAPKQSFFLVRVFLNSSFQSICYFHRPNMKVLRQGWHRVRNSRPCVCVMAGRAKGVLKPNPPSFLCE